MSGAIKQIPISYDIWNDKYRFETEKTIEDSWIRVATALASVEDLDKRQKWQEKFYHALEDFKFLPAGRILAGAGTKRQVTLFNCFVSDTIPDSMDGIFTKLREAALTMQQGGGIGYDFSTLRPKGAFVKGVGSDASGPLSFGDVYNWMCKTIMSAGARRGAQMFVLRCDHPDIEEFVRVKYDPQRLRNFNLSVAVTDKFMEAVKADGPWDLVFNGKPYKTIKAKELWDKITRGAYDCAEPGVIFIDRVNEQNNLSYCERISASNPCSEQMLPPYGACLLGSINLTAFVKSPFKSGWTFDKTGLCQTVSTAIRMLDNVVDVSGYPLAEQEKEGKAKRRLGLGITGLGDTLAMIGLRYESREALIWAGQLMKDITTIAYATSIGLAGEKGSFPLFTKDYYETPFVRALHKSLMFDLPNGENVINDFYAHGIRNALVTSIAPTGTISLLAGNISSGVEPIFDWEYERKILLPDGTHKKETVTDFAVSKWREAYGNHAALPASFVKAHDLTPGAHLAMQAALQPYVDSSISKTINCPENIPFEEFQDVYRDAYNLGLKCCAVFRPNEITGSVLSTKEEKKPESGPIDIGGGMTAQSKYIGAFPTPKNEAIVTIPPDGPIDVKIDGQPGEVLDKEGAKVELASDLKPGESYTVVAQNVNPPDSALVPRVAALDGRTYKIKWPLSPHAFYVTINNDHHGRPYEIFVNSKNLEAHAWTTALTRMVSAIFRRGGDISFVTEELKAVFDPKGGAWMDGKYIPSLLAAIGNTIEVHIGYGTIAGTPIISTDNRKENAKPITEDGLKALAASLTDGSITKDYLARGRAQGRPHIDQDEFLRAIKRVGDLMVADGNGTLTEEQIREGAKKIDDTIRSMGEEDRLVPRRLCEKCNGSNIRLKPGCAECLDCGFSNCG